MTDRPFDEGEEVAPDSGAASPEDVVDAELVEGSDAVNTEAVNDPVEPQDPFAPGEADAIAAEHASAAGESSKNPDAVLAAERLADLQRLNAEYVNYKRRVDRDRAVVQEHAVHSVLEALFPVLDDIHAARAHGDLVDGPFAAIADKLDATLAKFGLTSFGAVGEAFDPVEHEALMHAPWDPTNPDLPADADSTTVVTVLQPGFRVGERVLRPARVAVADPQ